jgi:hypothetical protein
MGEIVESTVPRRQLGRYLKGLREKRGVTVAASARALEWSTSKLWRVETGQVAMRTHDVRVMCRVYRATDEFTKVLTGLASQSKAKGWWHAHGDAIPEWFSLYVGLEDAAERIRMYEPELIPGLLQTKAYSQAFIAIERPDLTPAEVDRRVAAKQHRQRLLTRHLPGPPRFEVLLSEVALRRPIPDRAAMSGQLRHLAEQIERLDNVSVRVLPLAAGPTRASSVGPFVLLDFPDDDEPPIVYKEGPTGALYLDKAREIATYDAIWAGVAELALTEEQSLRLIRRLAEEYDDA